MRAPSPSATALAPLRKLLVGLTFAAVVVSVWGLGNVYLARRLIIAPAWPQEVERALLLALGLLAALPLLQPLFEHLLGARRSAVLAWPGYLYMGFALLLLTALGASDVLLSIVGAGLAVGGPPASAGAAAATLGTTAAGVAGAAGSGVASGSALPLSALASGVALARGQALAVAALAAAASGVALLSALRPPALRRTEVHLARWPRELDGLRIAQISDLHIGAMRGRRFAEHVAARVTALEPDLIAVTGDLVDGPVHDLASHVAPLATMRAPHGTWFVTGNHDYYSGADPWLAHLRSLGWRTLRNQRVTIEARGATFDLAGVDDHRAWLFGPGHGEDVPCAMAGRDPERAVVLLAHDPTTFKAAARAGVDLQISGHTHGGQIWPFGYFVRLLIPFLDGHYERDGAQLLVSRGTGFWGPPMRLGAPPEISLIVICSGRA